MPRKKKQPSPVIQTPEPARPMRYVYMNPLPSNAARDTTVSIHQIVLKLAQHLPKYGYTLTEDPAKADLRACHAGMCDDDKYADVAHCHGLYPTADYHNPLWFAINMGVIHSLRAAKAITVPSEWVADILRRDMGVNPTVVGWAVDHEEWQPADNQGYVIWNKTRADEVCSPKPLLDLAVKTPKTLFLSTYGDNPTPNVKVTGRVPYGAMRDYIRHAAVMLCTTRETFGISTIEAMSAGVPVLGYRWGGTADIVRHGVDGYLVEPNDINGLSEGLAYCLKYRDILGANARKRAQEYTWDNVAREFAAVYDRVLAPKSAIKVSVVIPCYNYGQWLGEAIQSVAKQNVNFNYEVIIVDDGSTDDSYNIARKARVDWMVEDYPISVIRKENGGVASARNLGIEHALGDYIVCLDADDKLGSPDFLQTLANALDEDRALGIAFTSLHVINEAGELAPKKSAWPDGFDFDLQAQGRNQIPTCNMFRREAWQRAGGYRKQEEPAEDAGLWTRIGAVGYKAKHVVQDGWFLYRDHENSLSKTRPQPNWRNFAWVHDNQRPFASQGKTTYGSYPVRNYDTPLVSIIIPLGVGHDEIVKRALDSIEAQTERRWECIVVSDGGHLPVYGYAWVKVAETGGTMRGTGIARNIGLRMAKAPLVTFLDADDFLHPQFLEKTIRAFRRSGKYIYTDWMSVNKDGSRETHQADNYDPNMIFRKSSLHAINVLMRRKDALGVGGFDENMNWEDADFFMKLAAAGICGERLAEPLFAYDYGSGARRELAELVKDDLKKALYARYVDYIEGRKMCSCGNSPKGLAANGNGNASGVAALNGMEVHPQWGALVMVEYQGAKAGREVVGAISGTRYQYRQSGETFYVFEVDMKADPESFIPLAVIDDRVAETEMPEVPELV